MSGRAGRVVRGAFPARFLVGAAGADGRCPVHDPRSAQRWLLGAAELLAARQFDGRRTYGDISRAVCELGGRRVGPDQLAGLERRLLALGLLEPAGAAAAPERRPHLRSLPIRMLPIRILRRLARVELVSFDPHRVLAALDRHLRWLGSTAAVSAMLASSAAALGMVAARAGELAREVPAAITGPGLGYLFLASVACAVPHEGGHAIACRRYGVPVESVGLGFHWFMPFAWTQPDQDAWSRLPLRPRVVTIIAGTVGSLLFAAAGGLLWLSAHGTEPLRLAGLYAVLAGTVVSVPTLLPIFDGDGYLLLTEVLRRPNLRRRAFWHLVDTLTDPRRAARRRAGERLGYLGFSLATLAGRLAATAFVLWLVWHFSVRPAIG